MQGCEDISNQGLLYLVEGCPLLTHLDVTNCPYVSSACFDQLVQKCPKLKIFYGDDYDDE
jgi:hypothetical protein